MTTESPDNVVVGTHFPPRSGRFKKGQSGNLKGRPKGTTKAKKLAEQELDRAAELRAALHLQSVLHRPVRVLNAAGKIRTTTLLRALYLTAVDAACSGNPNAIVVALALANYCGIIVPFDPPVSREEVLEALKSES